MSPSVAIVGDVRPTALEPVAMRLPGHKTPSMFLRYDAAANEDLADAVARWIAQAKLNERFA